ncbi:tRNA lysidine(34) synthetase TilS [uncultured Lacinutrix sp.]|uniref:tRNA lysidine(34) synthetase TilS n=1 Tax=uncultured Lacinutrix sp. TaxID=574032 RepID=UPI0026064660|nr:tRNA lysidine(34) synthetase TilS [uncultured Lacinutrix sp.]
MLKAFQEHTDNNLPFLKKSKILIALSGGLDSVVLTHMCHELSFNVSLAHCNFNLRGNESDEDENFVVELANSLDLEVFVQHFGTESYAKKQKLSIQMAARKLRYEWFKELTNQFQFDYILTAHHADDNLETFLINLTRGSGLDGLKGIPVVNNNIIRPLLKFSREDIESYANKYNLKWREDSSNASTKYLRNKLRHEVIPTLKEVNPQLLHSFESTIKNLNDTSDIVEQSLKTVLESVIQNVNNNEVLYSVPEFLKLNNPKAYIYEIFKEYGFTAFEDIYNLLEAQSGKQIYSKTHRLIKNRDSLILTVLDNNDGEDIQIVKDDKTIGIPNGVLYFDKVKVVSKPQKFEIFVDAETLSYPLQVRSWKDGDFFYPIGLQGKKKLSKYFKDEKLSLLDKEKCQLLCSNNEVVWVINYRADNRFKVTKETKNILKITLQQ